MAVVLGEGGFPYQDYDIYTPEADLPISGLTAILEQDPEEDDIFGVPKELFCPAGGYFTTN